MVEGPDGLVEKDTKTHAARRVSLDDQTVSVLTNVRLHDLRRFVATQLLGAGVDVRTVAADVMGGLIVDDGGTSTT